MLGLRTRGAPLGAALALGLVATAATGVATAAPGAPPRADAGQRTVTLITGDQVVLGGTGVDALRAAPGREGIGFQTFRRDGGLHVVPQDAARAVAEGRLDPRLFDVTGLVDAGYDDAHRDTVPLIVTGTPATGLGAATALPAVGATAAQVTKAEANTAFRALLADPGVTRIWLDGVRRPTLDRSTAQIGAPAAWEAGYTGEGVKVAVLDGGVDGEHPDLKGREVAEQNFTDAPDNVDHDGHGTHVAATIASNDAKYRGVAPGAAILDGKVCRDGGCQESWILAGLQWAVDQGADVVNLSLGGRDTPQVDPLEQAVNDLSAKTGALFVIAAGNSGSPGTIGSPGSADAALTVGAVDRQDGIAPFSSRGPRTGDGAIKPDITAPGVGIAAAKASQGNLGTPVDDRHVALSGTSMATPHVAGAAALLAQQHPDWTGAQLKAALMASAAPNPALTAFDQGAGRVDLARAVTATVVSEPASAGLGVQQWPHDDDTPLTKGVTYRNLGTEPVTLDLSVEAAGPDGEPAPAGLFTVTPAQVTVQAGGEAAVTVTADTRVGTLDGAYSGAVVGGPVRTPLAVTREAESYDVVFEHVDTAGRPAADYFGTVLGLDNPAYELLGDPDGSVTVRLPRGEYTARSVIANGEQTSVLFQPALTVDRDHTRFTFDARAAKPFRVTPPNPGAVGVLADVDVIRVFGGRPTTMGYAYLGGIPDDLTVGHLGPRLPDDELTSAIGAQFRAEPAGGTPENYRFRWAERGAAPTGFTRAPAERELAEVRTSFGPGDPAAEHLHGGVGFVAGGTGGWAALFPVTPGGGAVDHVNVDGTTWRWTKTEWGASGPVVDYQSAERTYRAGRTYRERFGFPVFGPGLPDSPYVYLGRAGDRLVAQVPLVDDAADNLGSSVYRSGRTALHRDGEPVGETAHPYGEFTVPPGAADYRLEQEVVRDPALFEFATRVDGAWTFRSGTVPGDQVRRLPLSVVRFTPALDASGGTPAGRLLRVPLTVRQQGGADNGRVRRLRVEVSFDDGRSWAAVPVAGGAALIRNPNAAGYASLRASGADSRGNTFRHTVIRAYKIR
ncbi:S8 family serine peptidase [Saccharothrix syringae]|uniref:Peptidase S8 n=1 Tax=Saccharothrix syringae TaxID=103733 RepID=A0A5Q0GW97_SACSY|nr:S8 family serine peptidase [Saccharothrix syringae]QFZ17622.1 peptidase S8 [Saccharothrix syringae]